MQKRHKTLLILGLMMLSASPLFAAQALMKFKCEGDNDRAKVYINGKLRGQCQSEKAIIFIKKGFGEMHLRAVKSDGDYERVFEDKVLLMEGGLMIVDVVLGSYQLTQAAIDRREKERAEKARKEAKAAREREQKQAQEALAKARNGDIEAMKQVAGYYVIGYGFKKSTKKSQYWKNTAEKAQNKKDFQKSLQMAENDIIWAMHDVSRMYKEGKGTKKSSKKAQYWNDMADKQTAQNTLSSAKNGDPSSMHQMAKLYADGRGIEKSDEKSKYWNDMAVKRDQELAEKRQKEIEESKKRVARANAQAELDKINFTSTNEAMMKPIYQFGKENKNFITFLTVMPTSVGAFLLGASIDVTLAPTKLTKKIQLQNQLVTRPARFSKPESMIALATKHSSVDYK